MRVSIELTVEPMVPSFCENPFNLASISCLSLMDFASAAVFASDATAAATVLPSLNISRTLAMSELLPPADEGNVLGVSEVP